MGQADGTEKIGKVTLDYTWYPGEDRYSDGEVEDQMLELARTYQGPQLEEQAVRECGWAGLYHFSHVRRNILSWLPLKKTDRVLEAGSGPGAVTGILAEHAGSVTCIDLSRKRSRINAYRNRERDNIRILVGNIQDIARQLDETFDVITLIGVFEYAQYSIRSQKPFLDYLAMLRPLLAPGGRLVIAIENRLGMKYWAGAAEDHTGLFYDGLEGYPSTDYVRTFSRPAMEKLLKEGGFGTPQFYYPYPDYKLPDRIHSDRHLPGQGELNRGPVNLDRVRMDTFREELAYDQMIADGLYPLFANSYFVIVPVSDGQPVPASVGITGKDRPVSENVEVTGIKPRNAEMTGDEPWNAELAGNEPRNAEMTGDEPRNVENAEVPGIEPQNPEISETADEKLPVYVKFSNERAPEFRIRTEFLKKDDGSLAVRKVPDDPLAVSWIGSLPRKHRFLETRLAPLGFEVGAVRLEADGAILDWVEGEPLEQIFDRMLRAGKQDECQEGMLRFLRELAVPGQPFAVSDAFTGVFGETVSRKIRDLMCRIPGDKAHNAQIPGDKARNAQIPGDKARNAQIPGDKARNAQIYGDRVRKVRDSGDRVLDTQDPGSVDGSSENQLCAVCADLDLIFSNVIVDREKKTVIDYEWTFDFEIPAGFLQYRCIRYYVQGSSLRMKCLKEEELYRKLGLSSAWISVFEQMEDTFQQFILGGYCPIWKRQEELSPGLIPVLPLVEREQEKNRERAVEVFFDDGTGFSPQRCRTFHPCGEEAAFDIRIPEGTKQIRVDPATFRCVVRVSVLKQGGHPLQIIQTNGHKNGNGDYVFDTEDPQMIIPVSGTQEVRICFRTEEIQGLVRDAVLAQSPLVRWAAHTPLWKAWKGLRRKG